MSVPVKAKLTRVAMEFEGDSIESCEHQARSWREDIELAGEFKLVQDHAPEKRQLTIRRGGGGTCRLRVAWKVKDVD